MIGRYSELNSIKEVENLEVGMDFRKPEYRREVFKRLYEFNLKYKAHAGFVYGAFPYLNEKLKLDEEQKLWLGFINGCSQNIVTSWIIFQEFPDLKNVDINKLEDWWNENYIKFMVGKGWDLDRRYFINYLIENGIDVKHHHGLTPEEMIQSIAESKIGINFSKNYNANPPVLQMKGRMVEVPAANALLFTEYAPGLEEHFIIDKEVITFKSSYRLPSFIRP